ncbi:MAG: dependent oxidoreductase [Firmicutes bacterium]|nr:dependent oxidoreductase [Bacillota bacterium]
MSIKGELEKIVGKDNVSDAIADLNLYSQDLSLLPPGMANAVVWPANTEEVAQVVAYCNENTIPVVPVSSRVHTQGSTIPKQGGVVIDLKRMNNILEIDLSNRLVRFQAGVTWAQLTAALKEKGMRAIMPLLPRPNRSVLTDTLEREVTTNMVYDYGEPTQSLEIVWANGTIFRSGSASVNGFPESISRGANPSGPGLDFYRFMQGAQGTMGIVTWMSMKIESIPKIDKIFLAPVKDIDYAQEFLYRILPRRIGQECVLLNNVDLAGIMANKAEEFDELCAKLPPWTLALTISGVQRRPEEKIAYEEKFLKEVLHNEFNALPLSDKLPGFPGLGRKLLPMLRAPWPEDVKYWKNSLRGGCQDIFFIARPNKVSEYIEIMDMIAAKNGYPISDIGKYIQPIEHNRACQIEFSLFYSPDDEQEKAMVAKINREAAVALMNAGGFFSRPYGEIAPIVYDRAANYTMALRRVKNVFDPNNIMNPGNVCF